MIDLIDIRNTSTIPNRTLGIGIITNKPEQFSEGILERSYLHFPFTPIEIARFEKVQLVHSPESFTIAFEKPGLNELGAAALLLIRRVLIEWPCNPDKLWSATLRYIKDSRFFDDQNGFPIGDFRSNIYEIAGGFVHRRSWIAQVCLGPEDNSDENIELSSLEEKVLYMAYWLLWGNIFISKAKYNRVTASSLAHEIKGGVEILEKMKDEWF